MLSDEELFNVMPVIGRIRPEDMPRRPLRRVRCDLCDEDVQDMRQVSKNGKTLCRACAEGRYYIVEDRPSGEWLCRCYK